jgi:hypothetical protein
VPARSDAALDRRLAASEEARCSPLTVPYFAPVTEHQATRGEPAGFAWVLRTAGLVIGGTTAVGVTIAGAAGFLDGRPAYLGLFVLGLLGDVLVVGAFVRRWRGRGTDPAPA